MRTTTDEKDKGERTDKKKKEEREWTEREEDLLRQRHEKTEGENAMEKKKLKTAVETTSPKKKKTKSGRELGEPRPEQRRTRGKARFFFLWRSIWRPPGKKETAEASLARQDVDDRKDDLQMKGASTCSSTSGSAGVWNIPSVVKLREEAAQKKLTERKRLSPSALRRVRRRLLVLSFSREKSRSRETRRR